MQPVQEVLLDVPPQLPRTLNVRSDQASKCLLTISGLWVGKVVELVTVEVAVVSAGLVWLL